jgi:hypothetical protein
VEELKSIRADKYLLSHGYTIPKKPETRIEVRMQHASSSSNSTFIVKQSTGALSELLVI